MLSPKELLELFEFLQARADRTGIPERVMDGDDYVGILFPKDWDIKEKR